MGFCNSWAGRSYNQQQCISKLWFGLDKQHWVLVLNINFYIFTQQQFRADSWSIPNHRKALFVGRHTKRHPVTFKLLKRKTEKI
jgi:hypothetical protein